MHDQALSIDGVRIPPFLYGTAWKEEATQLLTELALQHGFRGIDTANQRRHYHEAGVGQAIGASIAKGFVARDDLFVQSKFTFRAGQDHRLPYDPDAPVSAQVEQSFASSLDHLGVETLDSYLLHGPTTRGSLQAADWAAWRAMEAIHDRRRVRLLGVSNMTLEQLQSLCREARIQPRFLQNRCFAITGWDRHIRKFCAAHGIVYQGFSLLTANREVLAHPEMSQIAQRHCRTVSQVIFRFAAQVGMLPLTGTSDPAHMCADLDVYAFRLEPTELERIETLVAVNSA